MHAIPPLENRLSSFPLGGSSIRAGPSFLSVPRARAGRESVIRLIHRIWLAFNGDGRERAMAVNMVMISPKLEDKRKITAFFMFS